MVESVIKATIAFVYRIFKMLRSFRASGTDFDPIVCKLPNGYYGVELVISPGYDEVCFDSLEIQGCEIASGIDRPTSAFKSNRITVDIRVAPKQRGEGEECASFIIKPTTPKKDIQIKLRGGWLNILSCKRRLP